MLVPRLEPFISLVGAVFFSFLGIFIPAVVETVSCWDGHLGKCFWRVWKNIFLVIVSIAALISGTWVSVLDIAELYTEVINATTITTVEHSTESILLTTLGILSSNGTMTLRP